MNHIEEKIIQTIDEHRDETVSYTHLLVREDRDGRTAGGPVGLPKPWPGSQVRKG